MHLKLLMEEIRSSKDDVRARHVLRFFKTGKGQYGEGDKFLGLTVPVMRKIAKKYTDLSIGDISKLIKSEFHEERLIALFILGAKFKQGDEIGKKVIFDFYLNHTKYINNWDLVDTSAGYIVGEYLLDKDREVLKSLATSKILWERRIAIIATFAFIYRGEYDWTFKISEILISDKHDLIQKAVGWMLREVGKRISVEHEEEFLLEHYKNMGRTCLRYAIERFPEKRRKEYLLGLA